MIKTLSPYYVTTPFVSPETGETCTSYTLNIYVWDGDSDSPPSTPNYQITKSNPTASTGNDVVNVARILNSYLDLIPQEGTGQDFIDGNNQKWCKITAVYETSDEDDDDLEQNEIIDLIVRGYAYGIEGENTDTPDNLIMQTGTEFKVSRRSFISLPIEQAGVESITVKSYPNNEINETFATASTIDSADVIKYIWINTSEATSDDYIEIIYNSVTLTYRIIDECRFTPLNIFFFNKEGAQQSLTFFKQHSETLSLTSEEYESGRGQPINGFHQINRFNVNGKTKLTANSGFMYESNNEAFKQLLLSERFWLYQDGIFIPLNIATSSFEYKTRQKDRLINYEIEFDYAYNEINNV